MKKKLVLKPSANQIESYINGSEDYCPFQQAYHHTYDDYAECQVDHSGIFILDNNDKGLCYKPATEEDSINLMNFIDDVDAARNKYVYVEAGDQYEPYNNKFLTIVPAKTIVKKNAPRPTIKFILDEGE